MASELRNDLTWSVSRHRLFQDCRRAYYYNYYGSWGGWERNASPATRQLYVLKNIRTLPMWGGTIVHGVIAAALERYALHGNAIEAGELQAHARHQLRQGWVEATQRAWLQAPKKTNLFDLYYGNGKTLPPEDTDALKQRVYQCLTTFADSDVLQQILAVHPHNWKPIDKLDSFLLDDIKVWCAIDFAYTDPAQCLRILDWKTGPEKAEALRLQLACYTFFASEKWHSSLEQTRVFGIFLRDNARSSEYALAPTDLIDARDEIVTSAAMMRECLADPRTNSAREADFPPTAADYPCQQCNFREVCPKIVRG